MAHGSQGLFTQVGFNDPSQDDASQSPYSVTSANQLQSQVYFILFYFLCPFWLIWSFKFDPFSSIATVDKILNVFAGLDEFSLLSALCPLQHATTAELAGSTTAASAGSELSKSENPF